MKKNHPVPNHPVKFPAKRGLRRALGLLLFAVVCLLFSVFSTGCTAPLISSNIDIEANGNTVTPGNF